MRRFLLAVVCAVIVCGSAIAAQAPKNLRTVRNLPDFPIEVLKRTVSPKFYKSLTI